PALREEAVKVASRYKIGPIFTPPVVSTWPGPLGTLMLPNATGGANWQGGAFDPETKMFYIFTNTAPTVLGLVKPEARRSDCEWVPGPARDPNAGPRANAGRGGRGGGEQPAAGGGTRGAAPQISEAGSPIQPPAGGGGGGGRGAGGGGGGEGGGGGPTV